MNPRLKAAFFASGAAALVYEVVWTRQMELMLGAASHATAVVLACFMGGLALGSFAGGRLAQGLPSPLRAFAWCEAGLAAWALAFPLAWSLANGVYLAWARPLADSGASFLFARILASAFLILPPAFAMGLSFPLFAAGLESREIPRAYGLNTLGACLGVMAGTFLLLPQLGQRASTLCAALLNAGACFLALRESGSRPGRMKAPQLETAPAVPLSQPAFFVAAALSGFASMVLEVALARTLVMNLGASAYAFGTMLSVFLLGLGAAAIFSARSGARASQARLGFLLLCGCLSGLFCLWLLPRGPELVLKLISISFGLGFGKGGILIPVGFLASLLTVFPVAFFAGAALPEAMAAARQRFGAPALGWLYGANTLAAVGGSLLTGFVLIPRLGMQGALLIGSGLLASGGLFCLFQASGRAVLAWASWPLLLLPPLLLPAFAPRWDSQKVSAGIFRALRDIQPGFDPKAALAAHFEDAELLYFREGVQATVSVGRARESGRLFLSSNGKVEAGTGSDIKTQILLGQVPSLLLRASGRPGLRAGIVGMASGMTAGSVLTHPFQRLDIMEIEEAMLGASVFFNRYNGRPLEDPRTRIVIDDARNWLKLHPGAYDLVVSEPSNPWVAGVGNLFTREAMGLFRQSLSPGGVFCQWLQAYEMDAASLHAALNTFRSEFPHALIFQVPDPEDPLAFYSDLLLIGSSQPLVLDPARLDALVQEPAPAHDLKRARIQGAAQFMAMLRIGDASWSPWLGQPGLVTDDNARLEYSSPLAIGNSEAFEGLLKAFLDHQSDPTLAMDFSTASKMASVRFLENLAREYDLRLQPSRAEELRKKAKAL